MVYIVGVTRFQRRGISCRDWVGLSSVGLNWVGLGGNELCWIHIASSKHVDPDRSTNYS